MKKILLFILSLFLIVCNNQKPKIENENEVYRTDVNGFQDLVHFSIRPIKIKWAKYSQVANNSRTSVSSPSDYYIIGILSLEQGEWSKLKLSFSKKQNISNDIYLERKFIKSWFPKEITSQLTQNGKYFSINNTVYDFKEIYSGFYSGYLFFADNNYVFVYLHNL